VGAPKKTHRVFWVRTQDSEPCIVLLWLSKRVPKLRFFAKPNGTETAVLCLCIDGSALKWSSSGVLNVTVGCRLQVILPTCLAGGCYRWDRGEIAGGGGSAPHGRGPSATN